MKQSKTPQDNQPRLIKRPEVQHKTGLSRTGIYDRVRRGEFPAPVSLGGAAVAWVEAEVDAWVNARIEASRTTGKAA
ncbi:MAG TPA: AlpA family transcriptional regulator [Fluviicoccus sp.]|nr:AlpA family transcriptional regulator [Fluviicoccus sp.]